VLQCVEVQFVAVCCNVLQCDGDFVDTTFTDEVKRAVVCCIVAACCSVLQYSLLQCVAVKWRCC